MKKIWLALMLVAFGMNVFAKDVVKVACVGNSITYGTGIKDRDKDSYPVVLQNMLGSGYEVRNFGKPGATLLRKGHRPYFDQQEYKDALAFAGDIVVIHLGVNDTDPRNWPNYRDEFIPDYLELIKSFKEANPKCEIYIARLTPITYKHFRFESGTRDWHDEIQIAIENVAKISGSHLISFFEELHKYPYMMPDAVHPNEEGAVILANTVYQNLTGNFGGLKMADIYTDNMVLQRNVPLKIKGTANAGDKVTVSVGKQKVQTITRHDGQWSVKLSPMPAGGPYVMTVAAGKDKLTYENVMIGEVWLCSGQSNMEFYLKNANTGKEDISKAKNSNIRLYDMKALWRTDAKEWESSVLDSLNHLRYFKPTTWAEVTPETAADFSAIAYYFGKMLQDSLNVPVGLICNAIGGAPTEAWIDRTTVEYDFPAILRDWKNNDFIQQWVRERAQLNVNKAEDKQQRHPYEPCYLYESGIDPLNNFPIKGVIWYQGESNAHNKDAHSKLFEMLVKSWRHNWGDVNMPFYFVQLSSIDRPSWPWFRDSQRRLAEKLDNVEMVVSSDKGDSLDVHPRAKKEIGDRLGYVALNKTYGHNVIPSGPMYKSVEFKNGEAIVSFDYGNGLKTSDGGAPICFEIAADDDLFFPATARIDGDKIILKSDKVKKPRKVRYAWRPFTRANLVNGAGLPASTFITD